MKKGKSAGGKRILSWSLSAAMLFTGIAPVQAADMFTDQTEVLAESTEDMEVSEGSVQEIPESDGFSTGTEDVQEGFSSGDPVDEFSAGTVDDVEEADAAVPTGNVSNVISSAADFPTGGIPAGETYELAADITLTSGQQISSIEGTLDGKGHVITLADKPLADQVSGVIQNLGVTGSAVLSLSDGQGSMANTVTGTIRNCYSTANSEAASGWMDTIGGLAGNLKGTVQNCYFAGSTDSMGGGVAGYNSSSYKIVHTLWTSGMSAVGMGSMNNTSEDSAKKVTADQIKASVSVLNTDLADTGYYWVLPTDGRNNGLPVLAEGQPAAGETDWSGLNAVITSAKELNEADYTEATWKAVSDALAEAEAMVSEGTASQSEADAQAKKLTDTIAALKKKKPSAPVAAPADASKIVHITSSSQLEDIFGGTEGKYYVLDQDITLDGSYMNFADLNGVFDGQGHTVTLNGSWGMFKRVGENGVVQNTAFKGTIGNVSSVTGVLGDNIYGAVINCSVDVSGTYASGFATKLSGGVIINCIATGESPKGAFFETYSEKNGTGLVKNSYWLDSLSMPSVPEGVLTGSNARSEVEMKTLELVDLLNTNKGDNGTKWGQNSDGFPYFGENQSYTPDTEIWPEIPGENRYQVKFTSCNGSESEVLTDSRLQVSPDLVNKFKVAGTLSLEGYTAPEGSHLEWSCTNMKPADAMAMNLSGGELFVYKNGKALITATQVNSDGSSEVVGYVSVLSSTKKIEAIKLFIDGQDVTNGSCTVAGSESKNIQVKAKYEGENDYRDMAYSSFLYKAADHSLIKNEDVYSSFAFVKPGTSSITVTSRMWQDVSASVEVTSAYVPIEAIIPGISGNQEIHGRNANSDGQETDGRVAFNPIPGSAVVTPANASFAGNWTISSSDDTIGYYDNGSKVYVPKQAGTVTYTAEIQDTDPATGNVNTITGSSQVTYVYKNPLTTVTSPVSEVTVRSGESQDVDLSFTGVLSDQGYNVSDPSMVWTFDKKGIATITKKTSGYWKRDENAPDTNSYFIGTDYRITGISEGTVTATGTPVDQTNSPEPVKITIKVTKGDGQDTDNKKLAEEGIQSAVSYITGTHSESGYSYGNEWLVYALLRSGQTVDQSVLDNYYNSVCQTVKSWNENQKPTDLERVALALAAMGKDITDVNGMNLAAMIYNSSKLEDGSNELIYALIALDSADITIPSDAKWSRADMIKTLETFQNENSGGIGLSQGGVGGSADITAMALQALAKYRNTNTVAKRISERAVEYLKNRLGDDFGYGTSESTAQVLLALAEMGTDPAASDGAFGVNNMNLVTNLMSYVQSDGGFAHSSAVTKSSEMSTVQALQALDAYVRSRDGKTGYWDLKNKGEHTHTWNTGKVTKESTCKEKGTKLYACSICGETKTEVLALAEHKYKNWKTVSAATVFVPEKQEGTCTVCGKKTTKDAGKKLDATVKLSRTALTLKLRQSATVKATGLAKGDSVESWKSLNKSVATVDKNGKITATSKEGKATIEVTLASGKTATVAVTVKMIRTKNVTKVPKTITLTTGKKYTLKPVVTPSNSQEKVVYWSGNKKIATVSSKGVITAVKPGKVNIAVKSGKHKVLVTVTVKAPAPKAIKNVPANKTVAKGKSFTLKPQLSPAGSAAKITYVSGDKKIATVDAKGKVTGKKKGTAVITVKAGKLTVKCRVTVK